MIEPALSVDGTWHSPLVGREADLDRIGAHVVEVPGASHSVYVSHPVDVSLPNAVADLMSPI